MPPLTFTKVPYEKLNAQQQEAFNFQKISSVLADFGCLTIPLSNDWNGADFIVQMHDGVTFHKVQLKSRLTFDIKYLGKNLHVCFRDGVGDHNAWYMYDHDALLGQLVERGKIEKTKTWVSKKPYHFPTLSADLKKMLEPYRIPSESSTAP